MESALKEVNEAAASFLARADEELKKVFSCLEEEDIPGAWFHYEMMKASLEAVGNTLIDAMPPQGKD